MHSTGRMYLVLLLLCVGHATLRAGSEDVVINEILYDAHPSNLGGEFLELFNRGGGDVDVSGWRLSDAVSLTFPAGTVLRGGGFAVVARNAMEATQHYDTERVVGEYEGRLDNAGETVVLEDETGAIVDSVTYGDRSPWPAEADGGGPSLELLDAESDNGDASSWGLGQPFSPGLPNSAVLPNDGDVVITEILYKPRRQEPRVKVDRVNRGPYIEDGADLFGEYIEIFNRSDSVIDLSGWAFDDGVQFEFAPGTTIAPRDHLLVAADVDVLKARVGVDDGIVGPFEGSLSDGGERLTLRDSDGQLADSVSFNDQYPWPTLPDENGGSLECIDPFEDNGSAANWRSSQVDLPEVPPTFQAAEDLREDGWQLVTTTAFIEVAGVLAVFTGGAGEWLLDGVEVAEGDSGQNLVSNGSFEDDERGWTKRGNHEESVRTTEDAKIGNASLRIVATGPGATSGHNLRAAARIVNAGQFRVSYWVKHLSGNRTLHLRIRDVVRLSVRWPIANDEEPEFDLARDWSDGANPFDAWSLIGAGDDPIVGESTSWLAGDLGAAQPAWTDAGDDGTPGWCKSVGAAPTLDFPAGRIGAFGPATLRLTVPSDGRLTISGGVYLMRHGGNDQIWQIVRKGAVLTDGVLVSGEAQFNSEAPQSFASGTGDGAALTLVARSDDTLDFRIGSPDVPGEFVGVDLKVHFFPGTLVPRGPPISGHVGRGTPGRVNSVRAEGIPPLVEDLAHLPEKPTSEDAVTVTASVTSATPLASITLQYSLGLSNDATSLDMFDDGEHGDGVAGDGVYGGTLPAKRSQTLVHYFVRAEDSDGRVTYFPYQDEPSPTEAYFHYDEGEIATQLTIFQLFTENANLAQIARDPRSNEYYDASLVIDGIAYPHIGVRRRGRGIRLHAKNQWKFRFNRAKLFNGNRILDTKMQVPFVDTVVFRIFDIAGLLNLESDLVRVHLNGSYWGLYNTFEVPNSTWLRKHGFDAGGEVYKARSVETPAESLNSDLFTNQLRTDGDFWGAYNKMVRPLERPVHVRELVDALNKLPAAELLPWIDANIDVDGWFSRYAVHILTTVADFGGHNYYLFLPGEPDGRKWTMMGYDFKTFNFRGLIRATFADGKAGDSPGWERGRLYRLISDNATLRRIHYLNLRDVIERRFPIETEIAPMIRDLELRSFRDRSRNNGRWTTIGWTDFSAARMISVLNSQRQRLVAFLDRQDMPRETEIPSVDPPGGVFADPVTVTLTEADGWQAVYTLDGSDPRLSTTRIVSNETVSIENATTLKVVGLRRDESFTSGHWTDVTTAHFDIDPSGVPFVRGDVNADGALNITDAVSFLRFTLRGGAEPTCQKTGDWNDDGSLRIDDAIQLLDYLFRDGAPAASPFPACGVDRDEGEVLTCLAFSACR